MPSSMSSTGPPGLDGLAGANDVAGAQDVGLRSLGDEIGQLRGCIDDDAGSDGQAAVAQIVHHAQEGRGRTHRDGGGLGAGPPGLFSGPLNAGQGGESHGVH